MTNEIKITVANKLVLEKRDLFVYHHASKSTHIISFAGSYRFTLKHTTRERDYLHLSINSGPGPLQNESIVEIPSWIDFEFHSQGNIRVNHLTGRSSLTLPPGTPNWHFKMVYPTSPTVAKIDETIVVYGPHDLTSSKFATIKNLTYESHNLSAGR